MGKERILDLLAGLPVDSLALIKYGTCARMLKLKTNYDCYGYATAMLESIAEDSIV
jgi:hypothetical protein